MTGLATPRRRSSLADPPFRQASLIYEPSAAVVALDALARTIDGRHTSVRALMRGRLSTTTDPDLWVFRAERPTRGVAVTWRNESPERPGTYLLHGEAIGHRPDKAAEEISLELAGR